VKNNKLVPSEVFKTIKTIINKFKLTNMVNHLCEIASVSRSGYYNYINSSIVRSHHEEKDINARHIILMAFNHRGYKKGSRSIKMTLGN